MSEAAPAARPSADDFLAIIRQQQLGKLKIYIGPSPGVGKTYAMLNEGRRLKKRGVDVVIGYVEPISQKRLRRSATRNCTAARDLPRIT
jgi:two-component system sensor histidine kinase KdpD